MPLGRDYARQDCSLARAMEVVGERWTLLVLRDLFYGVRRFTDLHRHLDIPRAVLSTRLATLVEHGLVERRGERPGRHAYVLTDRGIELWPAVHALTHWGDRHYAARGPRQVFTHDEMYRILRGMLNSERPERAAGPEKRAAW